MGQTMIVNDYAAIARRMEELSGNGKKSVHEFTLPPGCMLVSASKLAGIRHTNGVLFIFQEDDWSIYPQQLGDIETVKKFYEVLKRAFPSARPSNSFRPQIYLSSEDGRRLRDWLGT